MLWIYSFLKISIISVPVTKQPFNDFIIARSIRKLQHRLKQKILLLLTLQELCWQNFLYGYSGISLKQTPSLQKILSALQRCPFHRDLNKFQFGTKLWPKILTKNLFLTRIVNDRLGTCTRVSILWQRIDSIIFTNFVKICFNWGLLSIFQLKSLNRFRDRRQHILALIIKDNGFCQAWWLSLWNPCFLVPTRHSRYCSRHHWKCLRSDHVQFLDSELH